MTQQQPPPGAPGGSGGAQPSEEEIRAYLAQMRQADIGEILAQGLSVLLSGAQVKLGRRDGRVLLDAVAAAVDAARPHLDKGLSAEFDSALSQLRIAQVEAEQELARRAGGEEQAAGAGSPEQQQATDAHAPPQAAQPQSEQPGGSRLWVPPGAREG